MQKYELKDNTIDQYIIICPEKQIISALAKEESYAIIQHGGGNNNSDGTKTPSNTTVDQSVEAYKQIASGATSGLYPDVTNSKATATDYIGAFTYKVPHTIDFNYTDFKILNIQNHQFGSLDPLLEKENFWDNLYDNNDNNKLATLFKGQQLLRIPANRFNTVTTESTVAVNVTVTKGSEVITFLEDDIENMALQTPLVKGMVLAVKSSSINNTGDNEYFFDKTKTVKIIGLGGNKIILSEPALLSTTAPFTKTTLYFVLNNTIEKNYGKYYLKVSPKYVDFQVDIINSRKRYSLADVKTYSVSEASFKTTNRTTIYTAHISEESDTTWNLWNLSAHSNMNGRLLGSICEIRDITGNIKGQRIIGENSYAVSNGKTNINVTFHPDLIGVNLDTTGSGEVYSDKPAVGDFLRIYLKEYYFDPIFIEINYTTGVSIEDLIMFLMNDAVRDTKTGIMEIYDDKGTIINNGVVDGKVVQSYQFELQNNLEIRKKLNLNIQ